VTGHAPFRFPAPLPAQAPVHPQKIPAKSFVNRILPISPLVRGICAQNLANAMKTWNFGGEGGTPAEAPLYPYRAKVDLRLISLRRVIFWQFSMVFDW